MERLLPLLYLVFSLLITMEPFRRYIKCVLVTVEHKLSTKLLQKQCYVLECWKNSWWKVFTFPRFFFMSSWSTGVCVCVSRAVCRYILDLLLPMLVENKNELLLCSKPHTCVFTSSHKSEIMYYITYRI